MDAGIILSGRQPNYLAQIDAAAGTVKLIQQVTR